MTRMMQPRTDLGAADSNPRSKGSQPLPCVLWSDLDHQPNQGNSTRVNGTAEEMCSGAPSAAFSMSLSPEGDRVTVPADTVTGM